MRNYNWEKIILKNDSICNKCSGKIISGEYVWERTGTMKFVGFETGKDELPPVYFHVFHFNIPKTHC